MLVYILNPSKLFFQLADPGKIVQLGISAGSRSKPSIGWVRNILSNLVSDSEVDKLDRESAHIFSLFWMLIRKRLPEKVSDDLVTWLTETGIHRMSKDILGGFKNADDFGEMELNIGDSLFSFHNAEHAPPSGMMAANYSRHFNFYICFLSY